MRLLTYNRIYNRAINKCNTLVDGVDSKIISSKRLMLNKYLELCNDNKIEYETEILKITNACNVIYKFDDTLFYNVMRKENKIGNRVHEIFSEALVIAVLSNNCTICIDKSTFNKKKTEIWLNKEKCYDLFVSNTTDLNSLISRVNYILSIIKGNER